MITTSTQTGFAASVSIATANFIPALFMAEAYGFQNGYDAVYKTLADPLGGFPGIHYRLAQIAFDVLEVASGYDSELLDYSGVWIEIWGDLANWLVVSVLTHKTFPEPAAIKAAVKDLLDRMTSNG